MKRIFTMVVAVVLSANVWAQSPEKMSYQAIVRDASNLLVANQNVGMQVVGVSGRIIYNKQYVIEDSKISFDASSLNPGLYFINLRYRNEINNTFKFVKK